ncbi:MAG: crossover junction endodeoxyribonuclease RuvC [Acidobacteria bacterium]|nr:crossover junction endodeoxyribonuclease RuvC [Acidobacteriota bacterium]
MPKKQRILAIDPGTREMGVAVLERGTLLYSGVETFRKLPSPVERLRQVRATVARLLRDFRPSVLAVEKTFVGRSHRHAAILSFLASEIAALGRRNGITVVSLAANTVKKAVAGNGWATKEEVARAVTRQFPKLMAFLPPDRNWKRRRVLNMFDAVALALACSAAGNPRPS